MTSNIFVPHTPQIKPKTHLMKSSYKYQLTYCQITPTRNNVDKKVVTLIPTPCSQINKVVKKKTLYVKTIISNHLHFKTWFVLLRSKLIASPAPQNSKVLPHFQLLAKPCQGLQGQLAKNLKHAIVDFSVNFSLQP